MATFKTTLKTTAADSMNPFFSAFAPARPFNAPSDEAPVDAPEGSYTYKLVAQGPLVAAEECEVADLAAEIVIRWGTTVLHVGHLSPVRSFYVGEGANKSERCDLFLPEERLGARRLPLVLAGAGAARVVLPPGASGKITLPGDRSQSVADLVASGRAQACAEVAGAHTIDLAEGTRAELELGGLVIEISAVHAGKRPGRFSLKGEALPYTGLSFLLHAGLLAATALFMPAMAMATEDGISDDQRYELTAMLEAQAQRELDQQDQPTDKSEPGAPAADSGAAAPGEAGKAGSTVSRDVNHRFSVKGEGPERQLSRTEAMSEAETFGMVGMLASMNATHGPTSPFGGDLANGPDDASHVGNLFGETIGDAAGSGGLSLSGVGESGGGPGVGIGVGRIGTVGHDLTDGVGRSIGRLNGTRKPSGGPTVHMLSTEVSGRLPREVIQRIVRQNYGRFRACYEAGLRNNPSLQGRVGVRFVIGRDGAVSNVGNGGSDLPDAGVVSCVTHAFSGLSFPQPENGVVTVSYPILFAPAN